MKFLLLTLVMIFFTACAHYDGYDQTSIWAGQASLDAGAAAANANTNAGLMHIHHHTPTGMP